MLLKHFCDKDGWLWVGTRARANVFRPRPQRAFINKHIYTRYAYDGGSPSAAYEQTLGSIENNAAPVISRIVGCARRIEPIELPPEELVALQGFVFALACRTPESQQRVSRGLSDDDFYNIVRQRAEKEGFEDLPDRDDFYADTKIRDLAERIRHNADNASGGLDVLVCHDAPAGTTGLVSGLPWDMPRGLQNEADAVQALLRSAVDATEPAVVFHGHWHQQNRCRINKGRSEIVGLAADGNPPSAAVLSISDLQTRYVDPLQRSHRA